MRFMRRVRGALTSLSVAAAVVACGSDGATSPDDLRPVPNFVTLRSDAGDYIGRGFVGLYRDADATIRVNDQGNRVFISVADWWGFLQAMNSLTRLEPGYYPDLRRFTEHNPAKGGLDWASRERECGEPAGWFVVDRVTYSGGAMTALELRFEQHCNGNWSALRGKIRWTA